MTNVVKCYDQVQQLSGHTAITAFSVTTYNRREGETRYPLQPRETLLGIHVYEWLLLKIKCNTFFGPRGTF